MPGGGAPRPDVLHLERAGLFAAGRQHCSSSGRRVGHPYVPSLRGVRLPAYVCIPHDSTLLPLPGRLLERPLAYYDCMLPRSQLRLIMIFENAKPGTSVVAVSSFKAASARGRLATKHLPPILRGSLGWSWQVRGCGCRYRTLRGLGAPQLRRLELMLQDPHNAYTNAFYDTRPALFLQVHRCWWRWQEVSWMNAHVPGHIKTRFCHSPPD